MRRRVVCLGRRLRGLSLLVMHEGLERLVERERREDIQEYYVE
jgi:hypothetical protein